VEGTDSNCRIRIIRPEVTAIREEETREAPQLCQPPEDAFGQQEEADLTLGTALGWLESLA